MINSFPEILAPAGSPEQLIAAVRAGADAVYLGAGSMNARRSAANFSDEQLCDAVEYCHENGVRVHLTMNTLLLDRELEEAKRLAELACRIRVDAIIVQDLGLISMLRSAAPDMPLHASTQMSVHTPAGVRALAQLGFSRAVLSRELSRDELYEIAAESPIELEVFVHGALCMSVSGQCYFSSVLGGRSGNRGACAQPCRLPFVSGGREYCLSLKDNSIVEHIPELASMGIASLKIEGRMKRPEYCALAVKACRDARDGIKTGDARMLEAVFSRTGFTDGYFTGHRGETMFGFRRKEDVTAADRSVMSAARELYSTERQRVPLDMKLTMRSGVSAVLCAGDSDGNSIAVDGDVPSPSDKNADTGRLCASLSKLGGTVYLPGNITVEADEKLYLPASALNSMRRQAVEKLSHMRRRREPILPRWDEIPRERHIPQKGQQLHAVFRTMEQMPKNLPPQLKRVYLPVTAQPDVLRTAVDFLRERNIEACVWSPRGLFGRESDISRCIGRAADMGISICMVQNIAAIPVTLENGMKPYGSFGLNVTNTPALSLLDKMGLCGTELSFELTFSQVSNIGGAMERGVMIYGYLPMMLTRNCPARLGGGCGSGKNCTITDRRGLDFYCRCDGCCTEVFNSIPMSIVEKTTDFPTVDHFLAHFSVENSVETEEILKCCASGNPISNKSVTRGLYYRGVQ